MARALWLALAVVCVVLFTVTTSVSAKHPCDYCKFCEFCEYVLAKRRTLARSHAHAHHDTLT